MPMLMVESVAVFECLPVSMLYISTQFVWFSSTFVPTMTRSSSVSVRAFLLARRALMISAHLAASSSCGTSSRCMSEWMERVVRRATCRELRRLVEVGEKRPVADTTPSWAVLFVRGCWRAIVASSEGLVLSLGIWKELVSRSVEAAIESRTSSSGLR